MRVFIEFDFHRSPNKPEHIDDLRNRYRTIDWEAYDQNQKYLEIGENHVLKQHLTHNSECNFHLNIHILYVYLMSRIATSPTSPLSWEKAIYLAEFTSTTSKDRTQHNIPISQFLNLKPQWSIWVMGYHSEFVDIICLKHYRFKKYRSSSNCV